MESFQKRTISLAKISYLAGFLGSPVRRKEVYVPVGSELIRAESSGCRCLQCAGLLQSEGGAP